MKRFAVAVLTLLAMTLPLVAHAEWTTKELFWRKSGVGPTGGSTAIWVRDTVFAPNPLATSSTTVDTTADFTLDAARWTKSPTGTTGIDTAFVAYLLIQQDSVGAAIPLTSSITLELDGRVGGYGSPVNMNRYVQVDSSDFTFVANAAGTHTMVYALPIRAIFGLGNYGGLDPQNRLNLFYKTVAYPTLRARISAATGVTSGSLRAFIRYWKAKENDNE